jgi:hypothetical protein
MQNVPRLMELVPPLSGGISHKVIPSGLERLVRAQNYLIKNIFFDAI